MLCREKITYKHRNPKGVKLRYMLKATAFRFKKFPSFFDLVIGIMAKFEAVRNR